MNAEASAVAHPSIRLLGEITNHTVNDFMDQLRRAQENGSIVLELTTQAATPMPHAAPRGDSAVPLMARVANEVYRQDGYHVGWRPHHGRVPGRRSFPNRRYLLLIHERRLSKPVELNGPIRADTQIVRELLPELETAEVLERGGLCGVRRRKPAQLGRAAEASTLQLLRECARRSEPRPDRGHHLSRAALITTQEFGHRKAVARHRVRRALQET